MLLNYQRFKLLLENLEVPKKDEFWEIDYSGQYVKKIEWTLNNKFHREDGPAKIEYYPNSNQPRYVHYYRFGKPHRLGKPATLLFYKSGNILAKVWKKDGIIFRENLDEPASVEYYESGNLKSKMWFDLGKIHRLGKPAWIEYSDRGEVTRTTWYYREKRYESELDYYSTAPFTSEEFSQLLAGELTPTASAGLYRNPNFPGDPDEWILGGW